MSDLCGLTTLNCISDLSRKEIKEGAEILTEKILKYKPKIAVFNGKGKSENLLLNKLATDRRGCTLILFAGLPFRNL